MDYPNVTPHGMPEQLADNLFVVYGSVKINTIVRFTRNMAVVRSGEELTLINSVRMSDAGLTALESLGTVRHVLRLGPFHGMDDAFYVDRYNADFWSLPGGATYSTPSIDHRLEADGALPFSDAKLFVFDHMIEPEGAILLERSPAVLLTADALQSYSTPPYSPYTNLVTRILMPFIGFPRKTLIGPIWLQNAVTDRAGIREEFLRLMDLDFDQLLSAHGVFLPNHAKAEVERAFADAFDSD